MNAFFSQTYYFWIVTRIAMVFIGILSIGGTLPSTEMSYGVQPLQSFVSSYTILMLLLCIKEFNGYKGRSWINTIAGILSSLIGITLIVAVCSFNGNELLVGSTTGIFFFIWIIGLGLFDLATPTL